MRITIKTRLGLAFATVIILSGISAGLAISNLSSLNARLDGVVQVPAQRIVMSLQMSTELLEIVRAEKNLDLAENKEQADGFEVELGKLRPDFAARLDKSEGSASRSASQCGPQCVPRGNDTF